MSEEEEIPPKEEENLNESSGEDEEMYSWDELEYKANYVHFIRHNQAPCPATISVDPPVSAETLIITHRLCIISVGGNEVAAFYPFSLHTLVTGSQLCRKDHSPSSVPLYFSPLFLTCPCFNTPDPHHPHLLDPRSCDLSGSDYYSSMISLV